MYSSVFFCFFFCCFFFCFVFLFCFCFNYFMDCSCFLRNNTRFLKINFMEVHLFTKNHRMYDPFFIKSVNEISWTLGTNTQGRIQKFWKEGAQNSRVPNYRIPALTPFWISCCCHPLLDYMEIVTHRMKQYLIFWLKTKCLKRFTMYNTLLNNHLACRSH